MCGISGILSRDEDPELLKSIALSMSELQRHRGPDSFGVYAEPPGVALSHRRLSILDLSDLGHQPMHSVNNTWTVVFNGELYNFKELRTELAGQFRSDCDTEVLLAGLEQWGVEGTLQRLNGMFSFAAWNHRTEELFLARDRLGQKPLYYGFVGKRFVFCSELHSLRALEERPDIDRRAAALMLRHKAVPAPYSIYQGISKLPPATFCRLSFQDWHLSAPERYWEIFNSAPNYRELGFDEALDELDNVLFRATQRRLVSDVPLGAFLSGGIDSSLVVALMQRAADKPVKTFTIGFQDREFNEAEQAQSIAAYLGTDHSELYVQSSDVLELVPKLGEILDEPFGDPSVMPTYLLSRMTREQVTVALSGDGGDEAFGGYNRHVWLPRIQNSLDRVPRPFLNLASALLEQPLAGWILRQFHSMGLVKVRMLEDKLNKLRSLLSAQSIESKYRDLLSDWKNPGQLVVGVDTDFIVEFEGVAQGLSNLCQVRYADTLFYLPNDVLYKVDRASMAVSLEARSPFLDHEVFEFTKSLPDKLHVSGNSGKRLTRSLLERYLPKELFERPKMGFAPPVREWLRGPLVDWAESLLRSEWLASEELIRLSLIHI